MAAETLLPEGAVSELLGLSVLPRRFGVNIFIVNWNGRRLLDRADVLAWLQANADSTDSNLVRRLHTELADITAKGD